MATVVRYVNTDSVGGDGTTNDLTGASAAYASINAAILGEDADYVTAQDNLVINCDGTSADTIGTNTTTNWNGYTTSAVYNVTIQATQAHNGVWSDSIYRLDTNDYFRSLGIPGTIHVDVIGLQIGNSRTGNTGQEGHGIDVAGSGTGSVLIDSCIIRQTGGANTPAGARGVHVEDIGGAHTIVVRNCVIYGFPTGIVIKLTDDVNEMRVYNCTVDGFISTTSGVGNLGTGELRNCIATSFGIGGFGLPTDWTCTHNISSNNSALNVDTDAGVSSITNTTLKFRDPVSRDYHLSIEDTAAIGTGLEIGSFADDIDGDARLNRWDIGADQFVGTGLIQYEGNGSVNVTDGFGTTAGSIQYNVDCGSNADRFVLVGVTYNKLYAHLVTGVTIGGSAMTQLREAISPFGSNNVNLYAFYYVGPATGSQQIIVSHDGGNGTGSRTVTSTAVCWSGVDQRPSPFTGYGINIQDSGPLTVDLDIVSAKNEMIVTVVAAANDGTYSADDALAMIRVEEDSSGFQGLIISDRRAVGVVSTQHSVPNQIWRVCGLSLIGS